MVSFREINKDERKERRNGGKRMKKFFCSKKINFII